MARQARWRVGSTVTLDIISTVFEVVTAVGTWADVKRLYKDRGVAGVSLPATLFRTLGGVWAWYLMFRLELWLTVAVGGVWFLGAVTWLCLATYFRRDYAERLAKEARRWPAIGRRDRAVTKERVLEWASKKYHV